MKIMQVLDKKVGDKTYYKYRINLPKDIVEDMNLINKNIKITGKTKQKIKSILEQPISKNENIIKENNVEKEI
ncbi:MAG: hypothetical protein WCK90_06525, partial [archaeon]